MGGLGATSSICHLERTFTSQQRRIWGFGLRWPQSGAPPWVAAASRCVQSEPFPAKCALRGTNG